MCNVSVEGPFWLDDHDVNFFPPIDYALEEPNGLLCVGGDLSPERLLAAYRYSLFPWFNDDQPILWWSPNPRAVLFPADIHISRSLRKAIRKKKYYVTFDQCFTDVVAACAEPRPYEANTWISDEIRRAYTQLHQMGYAHSVEVWQGEQLVGGLYGIALGKVFFGESMFSRATDSSKIAFVYLTRQLQQWGFQLIDCQVASEHLTSLGAIDIDRNQFIDLLNQHSETAVQRSTPWHFDQDFDPLKINN